MLGNCAVLENIHASTQKVSFPIKLHAFSLNFLVFHDPPIQEIPVPLWADSGYFLELHIGIYPGPRGFLLYYLFYLEICDAKR